MLKNVSSLVLITLLTGCTNKQVVTEVQIVKVQPPVITQCKRHSIQKYKPSTNGELYECTLEITKQLNLSDQIDSLREWQSNQ